MRTELWIDGVLYETGGPPTIANNDQPLLMGENPDARNRSWSGLLDDFAVWRRALNPFEIGLIWNDGQGATIASLLQTTAPFPPTGTITRSGNDVIIQWEPAGGMLQSTSSLTGTPVWTDVGTNNPATLPIGTSSMFFRVEQ
jgi:hypothetical protein